MTPTPAESLFELRERNKKLEVSESMFRQLVENLDQLFFLRDAATGRVLYVSPAFEKIWDRSAQPAYAEDGDAWLLQTILEEDRPKAAQYFATLGANPEPHEYRIVRPDGTIRWIRRRTFPIYDKAGTLSRICGIIEDVTAVKDTESQLRQSQKMECVGRLAGGVAHDFNNVLTAINGYAEFLLAEKEPGEQWRADVQEIVHAAKRAAALTAQLLSFSRKQALQPRVVNLSDVVRGLDKMLRRLIGEDVRMELRCGPDLGLCRVDPGQLEQVVMNLVVNARDAMPDGGRLTIATEDVDLGDDDARRQHEARPGPHVRLSVRDTGSGMNADVLAHLFEPFFTTKEKGKGTGLGLPTVYGIVKQSGGHIEVRSEPGAGTTFDIFLPRLPADESLAEPALKAFKPRQRRPATILLVEDDDTVRPVTRRMLVSLGYSVLEARDGLQALQVAQKSAIIDLALVDMVMPGASGVEVLSCLRERLPLLKFVCMSGYIDRAALESGPSQVDLLQKPFTHESLAAKVAEALARPSA